MGSIKITKKVKAKLSSIGKLMIFFYIGDYHLGISPLLLLNFKKGTQHTKFGSELNLAPFPFSKYLYSIQQSHLLQISALMSSNPVVLTTVNPDAFFFFSPQLNCFKLFETGYYSLEKQQEMVSIIYWLLLFTEKRIYLLLWM